MPKELTKQQVSFIAITVFVIVLASAVLFFSLKTGLIGEDKNYQQIMFEKLQKENEVKTNSGQTIIRDWTGENKSVNFLYNGDESGIIKGEKTKLSGKYYSFAKIGIYRNENLVKKFLCGEDGTFSDSITVNSDTKIEIKDESNGETLKTLFFKADDSITKEITTSEIN